MRADYDSSANAISIAISDVSHADTGDEVHSRAIVALADGQPVEVQLLYPDLGISEPLAAVADRYTLDLEALHAAAQSALAAPRRRGETPPNPQPGQARAVLASLGPERVQRSSAVSIPAAASQARSEQLAQR